MMKNAFQKLFPAILAILFYSVSSAQNYSGERRFDGHHENEVYGLLLGGYNTVTGAFVGESATYVRHLTDRWSIGCGEQVQCMKWLYSAEVMGTYRLPLGKKSNLYIDGLFIYNRYQRWKMNETIANLSFLLEWNYVDLRLGGSYIRYVMSGVKERFGYFTDAAYSEPVAMTFGLGVNLLERASKWNLGIYLRNYDQFYYENWNINWGVRFLATLTPEMKLLGEFNVRPAGNLSQVATRYETSMKIGVRYVW